MNWTKEKLDELAGAVKAAGELTPEDNPFNADGDEVDVKILYQAATDLPKLLAALESAEKALVRFDHAREMAEGAVSEKLGYAERVSHMVRATTYWLSWQNFLNVRKALQAIKEFWG